MDSHKTQPVQIAGLFAVSPKMDCPHEESLQFDEILTHLQKSVFQAPCSNCDTTQENWLCLRCFTLGCSRFFNSHMVQHTESTGHNIALSFADGSFWCYDCDSYIFSKKLSEVSQQFSRLKFPEANNEANEVNSLAEMLIKTTIDSANPQGEQIKETFTKEELVQGLKDHTFKKVIVLTGAGISVSAGIPDFRSPGTGIYASLAEYKLPYPEAIFDIKYFRENPEPYYKLTKELFMFDAKPTITHHFIKTLADEGILYYNFTQNIDGLEIDAGLDEKYLMQAHGHFRTSHCIDCKKEMPNDLMNKHFQDQIIYRCECNGLVKPDIIFFGEALPDSFEVSMKEISKADLVIVMGTSLKVFPFAALVPLVPSKVPIVYINRENKKIHRKNFLFLEGDIDEQVNSLIKDLNWEEKVGKK